MKKSPPSPAGPGIITNQPTPPEAGIEQMNEHDNQHPQPPTTPTKQNRQNRQNERNRQNGQARTALADAVATLSDNAIKDRDDTRYQGIIDSQQECIGYIRCLISKLDDERHHIEPDDDEAEAMLTALRNQFWMRPSHLCRERFDGRRIMMVTEVDAYGGAVALITIIAVGILKTFSPCAPAGEDTTSDPVNHPEHYMGPFECIELTEQCDFLLGDAIKYVWRHHMKDNPFEDLRKAGWYLKRANSKSGTPHPRHDPYRRHPRQAHQTRRNRLRQCRQLLWRALASGRRDHAIMMLDRLIADESEKENGR